MKPILRDVLEGPVKSLFGGGSSKQTSRADPKDMTPPEFAGMRGDIASQLQNLFATGGGAAFGGPMTAGVSDAEQGILTQLQGMQGGSDATQAGQNFLQQLIGGGQGVSMPDPLAALRDIQGIQGGTSMEQANPFLQQAIEAAQRPLIQQYQEQIAPALRAQFTSAGQQIAGQGSSPFHMAAAREQAGMADALGDVGTRMAFEDFAQRQQLSSQEFQQLRNLMTQQELTGRGQDMQAGQFRTEAELAGRQQQLDAVSQSANIDRQQLDGLLANLEAQALPRLVEQLGIDRGLEEFRRREDQLMQALAMAAQVASPTVATVSRGTQSGGGGGAFGNAFGGVMGSAFGGGIANLFGG